MKRIITPSIFLSAQMSARTGAPANASQPADGGDVAAQAPATEMPHAWWVLHTVGRGFVVLHA